MAFSLQATKKQKLGVICSLQTASVPRLSFPLRGSWSRPVGSLSYISTNPPGCGIRQMSQLSILWVVLGLSSVCSVSFISIHTYKNIQFPFSKKLTLDNIRKSNGVPSSLAANNAFSSFSVSYGILH